MWQQNVPKSYGNSLGLRYRLLFQNEEAWGALSDDQIEEKDLGFDYFDGPWFVLYWMINDSLGTWYILNVSNTTLGSGRQATSSSLWV